MSVLFMCCLPQDAGRLVSLSLAQVLRTPVQGSAASKLRVISPVLQLSAELLVFVLLNTLQAKCTDFAQRSDFAQCSDIS